MFFAVHERRRSAEVAFDDRQTGCLNCPGSPVTGAVRLGLTELLGVWFFIVFVAPFTRRVGE